MQLLLLLVYGAENLGDSTRTYSTFAKHIFVAWLSTESHTSQASTLLTAVVLLLHEEVHLVESILGGAIFLHIVVKGLEQANHRHATFMFQLFHRQILSFFLV